MVARILSTPEANRTIAELRARYGPLMFHQSGGCCDGSQPMCFEDGELITGSNDELLGYVCECPFYMSKDQFKYWKHTQLTLDVTEGRGSSFSLEIPLGIRFIIRSRVFSDEELALLEHQEPVKKYG